jgi:hypothetical protein
MLTENAKKFLAKNPTHLTNRQGYKFYECPVHGDTAYIWAITPAGRLVKTDSYEMEDLSDWVDDRSQRMIGART